MFGSLKKTNNSSVFKTFFLSLVIVLNLISCDSPNDHRISPYGLKEDLLMQSYEFSNFKYSAKVIWAEGPYASIAMPSELMVFVYNSKGVLEDLPDDLNLGFFGIMPSMGHGLEDAGYFEKLSKGIYLNKNILFQMSGDWQMELSILNQNYDELDKVIWLEFF